MAAATKKIAAYVAYLVGALAVCDALLITAGLFPPKRSYGDSILGFPPRPQGKPAQFVVQSTHWRFAQSDSGRVVMNADGSRSRRAVSEIVVNPPDVLLAVGGDSQTDLPYSNDLIHPFVLEELLQRSGLRAEVVSGAQGGYSPLQAYLYFKVRLSQLRPTMFILNLYTGNDLFDMIRYDDRPHLEPEGALQYSIQPPVWYRLSDPAMEGTLVGRSRVLFVGESLARKAGLWNVISRVWYLTSMARDNGGSILRAFAYIGSLAQSEENTLAYPPAYAAQFLNQYLFFKYFPLAQAESLKRLAFLISIMRKEHPSVVYVMSPIPSAALAGTLRSDQRFLWKLHELGIDYDSLVAQEREVYDSVCTISASQGLGVIDNRPALHDTTISSSAFMEEDLHLSPLGSRAIGENEGKALLRMLHSNTLRGAGD